MSQRIQNEIDCKWNYVSDKYGGLEQIKYKNMWILYMVKNIYNTKIICSLSLSHMLRALSPSVSAMQPSSCIMQQEDDDVQWLKGE